MGDGHEEGEGEVLDQALQGNLRCSKADITPALPTDGMLLNQPRAGQLEAQAAFEIVRVYELKQRALTRVIGVA